MQSDDIQTEMHGALAVVTLNRPAALNALTLEMIRELSAALYRWEKEKAVQAVFIKGAGDRAFCSGGDIKAFYNAGMEYRRGNTSLKVPALFFGEEYTLNRQIYHYPKPVISFMNGITMGGGYGIAGNARYRIATDKTVFAMPEVKIGFFPDVGSMYHLLRARDNIGRYVALTGQNIEGRDMHYAGLADFYIRREREAELIEALAGDSAVDTVLDLFTIEPDNPAPMEGHDHKIEEVFAHEEVQDILDALEKNGSVWASEIFEILHERSPSSVCVTAEYLKRCAGKEIDEIFDTDFILAQRCIERSDLYEGINAAVIDRKAQPAWDPPTLKDITSQHVNEYFTPTGYALSDVEIFDR